MVSASPPGVFRMFSTVEKSNRRSIHFSTGTAPNSSTAVAVPDRLGDAVFGFRDDLFAFEADKHRTVGKCTILHRVTRLDRIVETEQEWTQTALHDFAHHGDAIGDDF